MGFLQRKVIALLAFLTFIGAYTALRETGFALEGAAAASYTLAVLGNAFRKRGLRLIAGPTAKPITEILLLHGLFLTGLIVILTLGSLGAASLPSWLTEPVGFNHYGRPYPSGLRLVQTALLFLVGFVESWWLTAVRTVDPSKPKVAWTQSAIEEERTSRLRLR
ncbi:MAG TPA: hypothetical protein VHU89_15900 [Acidobacteriaceae bacterium]|jgi:hypothetical protein|nr:hypothetical protein [Acidobacteriaceae bacterium]